MRSRERILRSIWARTAPRFPIRFSHTPLEGRVSLAACADPAAQMLPTAGTREREFFTIKEVAAINWHKR